MVWAESNYYLGERRNKEISLLFVLFGLYDLLDPRNSLTFVSCVRTYNSQVLLTRIEEVLPQVSLQVGWEAWYWLRTHCICTSLNAQRIFTNKRKGCWFKTQKVWGKFQRKVVLLNLNCFFVTRLNICRGESQSPEGAHNTFEKERICFWGFLTNFTCNIFWNIHFP